MANCTRELSTQDLTKSQYPSAVRWHRIPLELMMYPSTPYTEPSVAKGAVVVVSAGGGAVVGLEGLIFVVVPGST
jgi:hypothetical protein